MDRPHQFVRLAGDEGTGFKRTDGTPPGFPQAGEGERAVILEADISTCAKFVTTREYAPRLRVRWQREQELAADAAERGWERERERHACAARRIEQLLAELGEPLTAEPTDPTC